MTNVGNNINICANINTRPNKNTKKDTNYFVDIKIISTFDLNTISTIIIIVIWLQI